MSLKILLDECCPPQLAKRLRELGHEVHHVLARDYGRSDEDHAATAWADRRVVITADYDFGDMAVLHKAPFIGLIVLAPNLAPLAENAEMIAQRIDREGHAWLGHLTIIERDRIRRRPL